MPGKKTDPQANFAAINVTETVAGTLASSKFAFPFSIMDKMAIIISRIEYWMGSLEQLNSSTDYVWGGLLCASTVTDPLNQADSLIVDSFRVTRYDLGAAASGILWKNPSVKDFSNLAGGGLMVAPAPLYAAIKSSGAAGVMGMWMKLFYTYKELSADEYWELVESRRIISS